MRVLDIEQGTDEWLAARNAVITGTRLKSVLAKSNKPLLYELLAEQLAPAKETATTEAMERGSELEDEAAALYSITCKGKVDKVGFVLHDEHDWLGISPDRLVKKGNRYVGAVEIKCPDTKTHIKYLVENKIPTEYFYQVLHYFIVCEELEWLDFISYDPRVSLPQMQLVVVRVTRKELEDHITLATDKLTEFRGKWKQLITKYIF